MWNKTQKSGFELVKQHNISLKKSKGQHRSLKHPPVDSRVEDSWIREGLLAKEYSWGATVAASAGPRLIGFHSLNFGRESEAPDTRCWELPGVDVGDLLEGSVDVPNVITFHHENRLRRVEVILEDRSGHYRKDGQRQAWFSENRNSTKRPLRPPTSSPEHKKLWSPPLQ